MKTTLKITLILWAASLASRAPLEAQTPAQNPAAQNPAAPAAGSLAGNQSPASSQDGAISDVTVQGQAKDKVSVQKHKPQATLDLEEIVDPSTERTQKFLSIEKGVPSDEDYAAYDKLASDQVENPSLPFISEPPLLTYHAKELGFSVKKWELDVTDDNGDLVVKLSGTGNPVRDILWDGRDYRKEMVHVGTLYGYKFICIDSQGSPHTSIGETFQLVSLKYVEGKTTLVELSNKSLYGTGQTVLPTAEQILGRALDVLREYSRYPFTIEIDSDPSEERLADGRLQSLRDFLLKNMPLRAPDVHSTAQKAGVRGSVTRFVIMTNTKV